MPAKSKKQQRFMGMVHAAQTGKMKAPSAKVAMAAKSMTKKSAKDFASTKTKNLPMKKKSKRAPTMAMVERSLAKTKGY